MANEAKPKVASYEALMPLSTGKTTVKPGRRIELTAEEAESLIACGAIRPVKPDAVEKQ